ncbi:HAD family hydrolase [Glutamicibacter arilaitensis]|uniref:HAD family hydrolase n=1 Tax=Glutamicibacter arilaitensis TaxID=256701 RepID=UPI00384F1C2A
MKNAFDASDLIGLSIEGVLFDIDDTLVDLRTAAIEAFISMVAGKLHEVTPAQLRFIAEDFADDKACAYERYMSGELTFLGQRQQRLNRSFELVGHEVLRDEEYLIWAEEYESLVKESWKPFDDVQAHLDALTAWGIPFGAVSNNIESYQRMKLDKAGLSGFSVVIGSDTAGAPKPDPAPFLAGCSGLATQPAKTWYVGDNPVNDVLGAKNAGLVAVLVDRDLKPDPRPEITVGGLAELTNLMQRILMASDSI